MGQILKSQVAGMNLHYLYYTLQDFLDSMVKLDIESIELWGGAPHFFVDDFHLCEAKKVRTELECRNLSIVCFTPEQVVYPYNLAAKEDYLRDISMDYFVNSIKAAVELGAPLMGISSGWGYLSEEREEAWKRSRESLHKLSQHAEKEGVVLTMETLRPEESNLVCNLPSLKQMISEVNSPNLKVNIDTIAMSVAGESIQDFFDAFGKDVVHTHFVDGKPGGHLAWGDGILPLADFIDTLNKNGYQGHLGLEITDPCYFMDPFKADVQTIAKFKPFFAD